MQCGVQQFRRLRPFEPGPSLGHHDQFGRRQRAGVEAADPGTFEDELPGPLLGEFLPAVASARSRLAICLEPRPEVAAVASGRPIAVSGGVTPLKGLPGETTCGEMDPGIILDIARQEHWGPEQIDHVLTRRSGLVGLTGRRLSLAQVLRSQGERYRLARDVMRYRILMLAGAGLAAMGGLDAIVFSGRYAPLGRTLGPWMRERLTFTGGLDGRGIQLYYCRESLDRMLAETAVALTEPALPAAEA
ncbi:MAG: Acetate kinase [Phycisphaerae bacterium]|nr:Acetate kinase [Phycisphaerae bacterium]